jgi:putative transcriptional regulator
MEDGRRLKNRVRELRQRLGLRQADLAGQIGVTRQTILAIEKGRLNPSVFISLKLARILREPVDYLFYLAPAEDLATAPEGTAAKAKPAKKHSEEPAAIIDLPAPEGDDEPKRDEGDASSDSIFDFV